ncbi:CAP (Cysteine-rich secretory proteins [Striga asiatica]|uniref:CAP (Cysteine-rich secretory proteins) n=1 Tax=Striga asiatica TaxID=4170 RepID=A0A5A7RKJ4_STRAF|nr:CAP (Cysteine-rich secretory proteins [Striga asiatica]
MMPITFEQPVPDPPQRPRQPHPILHHLFLVHKVVVVGVGLPHLVHQVPVLLSLSGRVPPEQQEPNDCECHAGVGPHAGPIAEGLRIVRSPDKHDSDPEHGLGLAVEDGGGAREYGPVDEDANRAGGAVEDPYVHVLHGSVFRGDRAVNLPTLVKGED